jgi:apolipoprotein N-acyltransferase
MPPDRPAPGFRTRWAAAVAVLGGLSGAAAFPRLGIWPAAIVSVAALSIAVDRRRSRAGAGLGLLYGLAFFGPLLHWTGVYVGPVPWLILALGEAAFCAGLGAVLPRVQRLPAAPAWIGAAWVLQEALRDRLPFGGFPWGRLAFSQSQSPLRWFAALGGAPLVTFAVALAGGGLAVALRHVRPAAWRPAVAALAVLVLVPAVGALLALPVSVGEPPADQRLRVALIQGDVPVRGLDIESRARQVLDNHINQTMKLVAAVNAGTIARPDLVLWPENASDVDPFQDAVAFRAISQTVDAIGVPVLVGAILQAPGNKRLNAGILWSPTTGPGAQYLKRHPVPFGEYIPLRGVAEWVSSDAKLVAQDMIGGTGDGLLRGGPVPLGDVICFEVAYDSLVRSSVAAGAQILIVQTNNATFGRTAETYQQLAMSRLRAVETGRTVLQVATTGKSAVIDPNGSIVAQSGALFTADTIVASIAPRTGTTLAVRLASWPEYLLALVALGALAWAVRPARRRERELDAAPAEMVTM